jgi:uncharacterized protein (DUF1330 family)
MTTTRRGALAAALAASLLIANHAMAAPADTPAKAAYYFAEFELKDPEAFKPYAAHVRQTVVPYGGVYLAQGGKTATLEGAPPHRIVIMKFPDMDSALRWYNSPEYSAIRPFRQKAGETRNFLVEASD